MTAKKKASAKKASKPVLVAGDKIKVRGVTLKVIDTPTGVWVDNEPAWFSQWLMDNEATKVK